MAGSAPSGDGEEIGNINITPMVDVILVLLVIFMVTANFLKKDPSISTFLRLQLQTLT